MSSRAKRRQRPQVPYDYRAGQSSGPNCPNFPNIAGFGKSVAGALHDLAREHADMPGVLVVTYGTDCECIALAGERPSPNVLRRLAETLLKTADVDEGKVCG